MRHYTINSLYKIRLFLYNITNYSAITTIYFYFNEFEYALDLRMSFENRIHICSISFKHQHGRKFMSRKSHSLICTSLRRTERGSILLAILFLFVPFVSAQDFTNSIGMKMVEISGGSFEMGGTASTDPLSVKSYTDVGTGEPDEVPVHTVTISSDFFISEYEVTVDQYKQFDPDYDHANQVSSEWDQPDDNSPSDRCAIVSWHEAVAFCEWLSAEEGKTYRLPTEAEWEYVAKAGTATLWPGGNTPPSDYAEPNSWGVKALFNLPTEWVHDWYGEYSIESATDPVGPSEGYAKVVRGTRLTNHSRDENHEAIYWRRASNRGCLPPNYPEPNTIMTSVVGFRIVQATMPSTGPSAYTPPMPINCVKQTAPSDNSPDMSTPWLRITEILPIPPDARDGQNTSIPDPFGNAHKAGFHSFEHVRNHSPAVAALNNGDIFACYYTDDTEASPSMSYIGLRKRAGALEWDWPEVIFDMADVPEHTVLMMNDDGNVHFISSNEGLTTTGPQGGDVPRGLPSFKWITSTDNGATWSGWKWPNLYDGYAINSAFKSSAGRLYWAHDVDEFSNSLLMYSDDNGDTWHKGGKVPGLHHSFALARDLQTIICIATRGNNGRYVSTNNGESFADQGNSSFGDISYGERAVLLRLQSGNLFFATPDGNTVALSEDDGVTWTKRGLPSHGEYQNLGYAAATQSADGMIHLISSQNWPSKHYELNEAWIKSNEGITSIPEPTGPVQSYTEDISGGGTISWSAMTAQDGRYLLHGWENHTYSGGSTKYQVQWHKGRKSGREAFYYSDGTLKWERYHGEDGSFDLWRTYWRNGRKRSESRWKNHWEARTTARTWDSDGNELSNVNFEILRRNRVYAQSTYYGLTAARQGNGSLSVSKDDRHSPGSSVTITAQPDNGEQFTGWEGDVSGNENPLTVTMDSDKLVVALFTMDGEATSKRISASPGTRLEMRLHFTHSTQLIAVPASFASESRKEISVSLYSASGRKIASRKVICSRSGNDIGFSRISSGMYIVKISSTNGSMHLPVVLQ
ncbi:MAG: SUMF1/EgtB/PvdO family nonheme iron enzyme [Chitinivibrionales bacterium]|nr:SUMF1/EgtB/PvdO family nonheme iron enzyme [Chitinivibrionales bacterium]